MHSGIAATHGIPNSGWQQGVPAATHPLATHPLATHPLSATSNNGCQLPLLPFSSPMGRGQTHLPVISGFNNYQDYHNSTAFRSPLRFHDPPHDPSPYSHSHSFAAPLQHQHDSQQYSLGSVSGVASTASHPSSASHFSHPSSASQFSRSRVTRVEAQRVTRVTRR